MSPAFPAQHLLRTLIALVVPLLAAAGLVLTTSAPAHAEDGYRYWNYSHLENGTWKFADTGPGDYTPEDGAVEGWRYGTSTVSQGIFPRADLAEVSFDSVCEGFEPNEGDKRVAVVIDFGTEADADDAEVPAPHAKCALAPADATGSQVLEAVVDVRQQDGMTCALEGYPAQGCGAPVADAEVSADEQTVAFTLPAEAEEAQVAAEAGAEEPGTDWTLVAVLAVVVLLAALAIPMYRRKQSA